MKSFPQNCGVLCRIAIAISQVIRQAQGQVVAIWPSEVAASANVSPYVVGQVFRTLAERGYMRCLVENRRVRCFIPRNSPLWDTDYRKISEILETL
ncbi:MAG: hypothetical protein ACK4SY_08240 [Pyrobaculum sp.]